MVLAGSGGEPVLVLPIEPFSKLGLDRGFQRLGGQRHVQAVRVHFAEFEIFYGYETRHSVVIELKHPEFGVLIHVEPNLNG